MCVVRSCKPTSLRRQSVDHPSARRKLMTRKRLFLLACLLLTTITHPNFAQQQPCKPPVPLPNPTEPNIFTDEQAFFCLCFCSSSFPAAFFHFVQKKRRSPQRRSTFAFLGSFGQMDDAANTFHAQRDRHSQPRSFAAFCVQRRSGAGSFVARPSRTRQMDAELERH